MRSKHSQVPIPSPRPQMNPPHLPVHMYEICPSRPRLNPHTPRLPSSKPHVGSAAVSRLPTSKSGVFEAPHLEKRRFRGSPPRNIRRWFGGGGGAAGAAHLNFFEAMKAEHCLRTGCDFEFETLNYRIRRRREPPPPARPSRVGVCISDDVGVDLCTSTEEICISIT